MKLDAKPLYNLEKPVDVAAVILLGAAKLEGEISREQKLDILDTFHSEFHMSKSQAMELFVSSSYLLREEDHLLANLSKVLERSKTHFPKICLRH